MTLPKIKEDLVFQCPMCKSLTCLNHFSSSKQGLEIFCSICSKGFFVPSPSFASGDPLEIGTEKKKPELEEETPSFSSEKNIVEEKLDKQKSKCPKCFSFLPKGAIDCHKCGLLLKNVGSTFDPDSMMKAENPIENRALDMWSEVLEGWNDESKHEQFIQFCHTQKLLERAAFYYQKIKSEESEQAPLAAKKLSQIVELVQQQFLLEQERKSSSSATVKRTKWLLAMGVLIFGAIAFFVIWKTMSGGTMQMQIP